MYSDPEVQQALDLYQLGLPRTPSAGRTGELLGKGAGNSLEFQEYRQYVPGDDIRHLDWAAYARADVLMVRLYREEISPRTEILLDASVSMTTGDSPAKPRLVRQLAALFALLVGRLGGRPGVTVLRDGPAQTLGLEHLPLLGEIPLDGRSTLSDLLREHLVPLKRRSVRIVISDFLFPHDPAVLVRQLAADASALWLVQVLNAWEAAPTPLGGRRLLDVETQGQSDIVIDRGAIAAYRDRLQAVQTELLRNCRRAHATFATVVAEHGLHQVCREDLCGSGMLRVA